MSSLRPKEAVAELWQLEQDARKLELAIAKHSDNEHYLEHLAFIESKIAKIREQYPTV
jgi:hypothetical protein